MNSSTPRIWQTAVIVVLVAGIIALALSGFLSPALRTVLNPLIRVQSWISTRYMAVYEFLTVPRDITSLRNENAELKDQVSQLQSQNLQLQQQIREAEVLYALLDFARTSPENEYTAAAVIGLDTNPFLRYVIIDKGSDDGLRHGMPVVTEQGLVGRVDAVTAGAARVQLITDPSSRINIRLQSTQTKAMLTGSLVGDVNIEMIPQETDLQIGEVVLTSGLGGNYPADILVGKVISVQSRPNELFQTASIQPAVDFSTLRAVLVITNFQPVDIGPLTPATVP
ncbi:MAG TPA: rod shape-determining protein MreC [Anaerolineaceae bacterium]